MNPGLLRDVLTLAVGVVTGVLSAAFGVGGAVVSTPGIRALGATAFIAVGTTLPSILPSAAAGTARYLREHLIDWRWVAWTAPAGIVTSVGGSLLSHSVPGHGHVLMLLTAGLLGFTAFRMARARAGASEVSGIVEADDALGQPAHARRDSPAALAGVGAVAGLLSGLLGVGGGIVMVPGFTELLGMPLKSAVATSLACVGLFAVPGTIAHAALGDIDWRFALLLGVGVVPGARAGAALTLRAGERRHRVAVAAFLGVISVVYAAGEAVALARR